MSLTWCTGKLLTSECPPLEDIMEISYPQNHTKLLLVHPKMNILSLFSQPQVVANLCKMYFCIKRCYALLTINFHCMDKVLWKLMELSQTFCITSCHFMFHVERKPYRFGITWGWLNDDRIIIFRWTILLTINYPDLTAMGLSQYPHLQSLHLTVSGCMTYFLIYFAQVDMKTVIVCFSTFHFKINEQSF